MKQIEVINPTRTTEAGMPIVVGTLKVHGIEGTRPVKFDGKTLIDLRENRAIKDQMILRGALPKMKQTLSG